MKTDPYIPTRKIYRNLNDTLSALRKVKVKKNVKAFYI